MRKSKDLMDDHLGVASAHFAFPWAVASPVVDGLARPLFRSAALDASRTNRRGAVDPYRLGHSPILRSDGVASFRVKVAGMLESEAVLYRALGPGRSR